MKNPFRSTRIFVGEMVGELQKASWPTRQELRDSTVVVIVACLLLGLFTSISDFSLYQVVDLFTYAGQLTSPPSCPPQTSAPPGAQWFALHTLSGQENKVKVYIEKFKAAEELDDSIFEVLLPTETVSEVKGGKKSTKVRKLYPGYVFIQMRLYDEERQVINKPWYFVKEVAGVIGFVGGDHPGRPARSPRSTRSEPASRPRTARKCRRCSMRSARRSRSTTALREPERPHRRDRPRPRQAQDFRLHFRPVHPGRTRILAGAAHHRLTTV